MRQLVYTSLLLTIMLRFTCGEREVCSTIKNTQNIMNMIADAPSSQKKVRFFILAYLLWRRFILFIVTSVTIISTYQLVIIFFSKFVHFENVGCEHGDIMLNL